LQYNSDGAAQKVTEQLKKFHGASILFCDRSKCRSGNESLENLLDRLEPALAGSSDRYARLRHKLIQFFAWRLLGELPEQEMIRVETRFLSDGDYFDRLRAVEDALVDEYVRNEILSR
jgi:hypothetical protein